MFKEQRHQEKFDDIVRTMACEVIKGSPLLDLEDKTVAGKVIVGVAEGILKAQMLCELRFEKEQYLASIPDRPMPKESQRN